MTLWIARLPLILVAFLLLWPSGPAVAQPESLDAAQQRLLRKTLLDEGDIPALVRLHLEARKGYAVSPELAFPEPWEALLAQGLARMQIALLLENYEALLRECQRAGWLVRLAEEMQKASAPAPDEASYDDATPMLKMMGQGLQVFARRKLRLLDSNELAQLEGNPLFTGAPANQAELHLLAARAYLDQGEAAAFEDSLAKLKAYVDGPDPFPTLQIGYHCLARYSRSSPRSLEETLEQLLKIAKTYRPGVDPGDDVFWITTGDEVVALTLDLLNSYHHEKNAARKATLKRSLVAVHRLAYDWAEAVAVADPKLFDLSVGVLFDATVFEKRQGMFALFLTSEKVIGFLNPSSLGRNDPSSADEVRAHLERYRAYRTALRGFWLEAPRRFFPTQGDFWVGSALQRLEVAMKVELWSLEPSKESVPVLVEEVLALSPTEYALQLTVGWSDNLREVDPEGVEGLLSRAQKLASDFRLPAYALLLAQQRVAALDHQGLTARAIEVAEQALVASRDLVTPSTPVPGGRTMGELVKELAEFVALRRLEAGDTASALQQLDEGQALQSALQLSKDASRSRGEVAAAMQDVRQARAGEDRLARRAMLGDASVTVADNKSDFLSSSRELQSRYPELYDRMLSIKPMEFPRLQKHLPEDVVLLQYFPTDSTLFIFAVTRDTLLLERVNVGKADLDANVLGYLRGVRRVSQAPALTELSKKLYTTLIAPVEERLTGKSTILLVPSGRLNYLPFASLIDADGEVLGAKYRMSLLGKSSDLIDVLLGQPGKGGSMVVLADPVGDLPAARQEGEALAALFPGGVALYREQATRDALNKAMTGQPYLHLATHGEIDPDDPSLNYLVLAGGERLSAEDIFSLPLEAVQMVTLSACDTALGQAEPTASVVSLAESFWVTGPDSVVATLWAVNDASTGVFMKAFYAALQDGAGKARALQQAQEALRATEEFAHPYYWSPFVLLGDWR